MDAAVWTAIGLLAATSLGTLFYLGSSIDSLAARLDARIDAGFARVDTRFDAIESRLDGLASRFEPYGPGMSSSYAIWKRGCQSAITASTSGLAIPPMSSNSTSLRTTTTAPSSSRHPAHDTYPKFWPVCPTATAYGSAGLYSPNP